MNKNAALKFGKIFSLVMLGVFIITITGNFWGNAYAQDNPTDTPASEPVVTETPNIEVINPYFSIEHTALADGTPVSGYIINGPPKPPAGYAAEQGLSISLGPNALVLPNFPSFNWVFGCSAVSGAMIATYYDRNGYPNMYTGSANGGVMPLTNDASWGSWFDGDETYPNNPLIASHTGVDGRAIRGSIDDYWVQYNSSASDPYITGGWTQHTWGTAIGDFMKTSQSADPYNNVDGSTKFYNYNSNAKLTCAALESNGIDDEDGTYGRKLFYEARGYTVSDCYNQNTDNKYPGGFSLADFQAEINAGHPVMLNLAGHTVVGYGYNGSTIYIRDTWDNNPGNTYTMPWGGPYVRGGYSGQLLSVSVVHLVPPATANKTHLPLVVKAVPNQNPTDIQLSTNTIAENQPINTVVGTLSTTDPDVGNTFTYSLVGGSGGTDNPSFNISGSQLRTSAVFDYETKNSYSIRIRTTDQGGLFYEKAFTITVTPPAVNPIVNGDFEQGAVGWTEYSTHLYDLIVQTFAPGVTPYDGTWAVWLGGDFNEISYIQQQITVPADRPYLSYYHWIASADTCGYDFGGVLVNGVVVEVYDLCTTNNSSGWVKKVVNMSAYAGQSVAIQIRAECDISDNSNLFIDHVAFQASNLGANQLPAVFINIDASILKQDVLGK